MSEETVTAIPLPSADEFSREVIQLSKDEDISIIEATTSVCEKYNVEPEHCKKLIAEPLRVAIHAEASNLNLLKEKVKTRRLF